VVLVGAISLAIVVANIVNQKVIPMIPVIGK